MKSLPTTRSTPSLILVLAVTCATLGMRSSGEKETLLPNTPAGRQFAAWLAAVNSGDRDALRRFIVDNFAPPPNGTLPVDRFVARHFALYTDSQGYALQNVVRSADDRIVVVLQAKRTGYSTQVGMAVTPAAPNRILGFSFRGTEAPAETLPHTPLTDKEIADRTDALINTLVAADQFSGVILVARDDKPIYARAVGLASRAWNMPNRVDTKFNIASIGKMFTGVAVAQLVEQGKLSYDQTLDTALPKYPDHALATKITIGQLLTHCSGINNPGYGATAETASASRKGFKTINELLPTSAVDTLKFEPGSKAEYSNYGFRLLGAIIEKASGEDYYSYIREHIYKPAGMTNSDSYELDTDPPNLATGYMEAPGGARRSNIFYLPFKGLPEGLGYSTAEDLMKFALALRRHTLLNATSLEAAWTGRVDFDRGKYGYGFNVRQYNGTRIIGHGGGWVGITDQFDMLPDLGYTVVILNNIDSAPDPIAYKLHEWLTQGR